MAEKTAAIQLNLSFQDENGVEADARSCRPGTYQVILEMITNPELLTISNGEELVIVYHLITVLLESGKKIPPPTVLTIESQILPGTRSFELGNLTLNTGTLLVETDIWTGRKGVPNHPTNNEKWTMIIRD
ncbi:hypothetical protein KBD71_00435 [Candidatus Woesebacteria bacterium]|nr:hypothetical protein [Candidatus Woesebacteria bacterium]